MRKVFCLSARSAMSIEVLTDVNGSPETFLDLEVLQDTLEYALSDCRPLNILKITYELGSRTGDNFLGLIYRIKVQHRRAQNSNGKFETFSCIAKCTPNTAPNAFLHDCMVFLKEKRFYQEILPRLELLHKDGEKFAAKLYHTIKTPMKTLIFEDLQTLDYCMASRETGLDLAHCFLVLQKLGKFHAMSMILQKKHPELMGCLHSGLVCEVMLKEDGMPLHYYAAEMAALENRVRMWPGYEKIANKLSKFRENIRENLLKFVSTQPQDICVINHGDLWVNNALFKYADKEHKRPTDVVFVDFQMTQWASLGFDINYFFNTSVQLDILRTQRLRLLRAYYDSLSATLAIHREQAQQVHLKVPTFTQVLHEVEKREPWGFFAAFAILPMISLDKDQADNSSIDNLADPEFASKKLEQMFATKKVQDNLKYSLKRFDELKVFG